MSRATRRVDVLFRGTVAVLLATMAYGCSDSTPPETVGTVAAALNSDQQTTTVGTSVPIAPAVLVKSTNNNPMAGVAVTFAVASGGGSVAPATATTNASGIATADHWTLGTASGTNSLTATAAGGQAVTLTAVGNAGPPTKVTKLDDGQSAAVGATLPNPPGVKLQDQYDNPVANLGVTFAVASGGGTIQGPTATTSATGEARVTSWTLGTSAGANTLTVTATGLTAVTLAATATAGTATNAAAVGNNQQATVGTPVAVGPGVIVTDQFNNPVAGVGVTFAVAAGGGSIVGNNATTDATGTAKVTSWTLGHAVGANQLTATIGTTVVQINATAVVGAAAKIVLVSGDQQSDTVQATLAQRIVSKLTDVFDNPIANGFVAYTVTGGGGSLSNISGTTDAAGLTSANWKLGNVVGPNTVSAALQSGSVTALVFTAAATAPPFLAAEVAPGVNHTCARRANGTGVTVYCWGANASAELGNTTVVPSSIPVPIAGGIALTTLSSGLDYSCGLDGSGRAYCWGANGSGQLGEGTHSGRGSPIAVVGSFAYQKVLTGTTTTCGLMVIGLLRCWGDNSTGMFGDGTNTPSATPVLAGGGLTFTTVAMGDKHICGITPANVTYCWGDNAAGQLGLNTTAPSLVPVVVLGVQTFTAIGAGSEHTCGVSPSHLIYCWGKNTKAELGLPVATAQALVPVATGFATTFATVDGRGHSTCGQTLAAGPAQCWGDNSNGQLDVPTTATPELAQPVQSAGVVTFTTVRLSTKTGCAIGSDLALYCWGINVDGQLGDGTTANTTTPVKVRGR